MANNYAQAVLAEHERYLKSPEGRCDTLMDEFETFEKETKMNLGNMRKAVENIQTEILDPVKHKLKRAIEANKYHMDWIEAMKEYYHTTEDDINKITQILTTKYYKESNNEK